MNLALEIIGGLAVGAALTTPVFIMAEIGRQFTRLHYRLDEVERRLVDIKEDVQ